jgi:hypothetical protein
MNQGWIKLHRKILDNPIHSKPNWCWLWICMLLLANHENRDIIWNGEKRTIERGQFITSRAKLALISGIHESSVERALKYLKNEQQIEQQTNKSFRLITINNYKDYQTTEQQNAHQMNNKRTTNEQRLNTNKNEKNYNNEKNEKKRENTPAQQTQGFIDSVKEKDELYLALSEKLSSEKNIEVDKVRAELDKFVSYWTELNRSGTKQRWELEKAFEVQRRLATWFSRASSYKSINKPKTVSV